MSGIIFSDASLEAGEGEDNEWEKPFKGRHPDAFCRAIDLLPTLFLNQFSHEGERITNRGTDDILTPPPNPRG